MITREEDIDAHALHRQGWTISAIARHLGRDRKTIRAYLRGDREAGVRAPAAADPFGPFAAYCAARLAEDPHLWATSAVRRGDRAGVRLLLSDVHPAAAGAGPAPALRAVSSGEGPGGGGDRAPAG